MRLAHPAAAPALLLLLAINAFAQSTAAPAPEPAGNPDGQDYRGYNIVNSWEAGYRTHTVGGNEGKYRSDVNFGNGIRLLSSHLGVYSKDGQGRLFDELVLSTQGLGNDPYQFANLRLRKNKLYEYNFLWRWNTYFNPGLTISEGQHRLDTTRRWQDHGLTLFPSSRFRGILGYGRNTQDGPGLSTVNMFGSFGDEFPFFSDIRRENNEYRAGGEVELGRFRFRAVRVWENFKEDTTGVLGEPSAGADPDAVILDSFRRGEPYRGNSNGWRGFLFADPWRWLSVSARGSYTGSDRQSIVDESSAGVNRFGRDFSRQVVVFGTGRRPVGAGSGTINLFPTDRLTIANHTAYYNVRMEGDSVFQEFNNQTFDIEEFSFQSLGIRTLVNTADVNYRALPWFGVYGGYHYSTRRIRSRELLRIDSFEETVSAEQDNTIHSGLAGVRVQPFKPLTINLEAELGRADQPFYPISGKNYHLLGARIQYKTPALLFSAATRINYNTNSVTLSSHSSRSRTYAFDFSWTPSPRFSIDAGYNKIHLDTLSGIAYFAASQLVESDRSLYVSNIHSLHASTRIRLTDRVDFFAGYSRVQDTGDGRGSPAFPPAGVAPVSSLGAFLAAQTFPLSYQSPSGRLSFRLQENLRWNAGYQYYGYSEQFLALQNYRAHTGYLSLQWSF